MRSCPIVLWWRQIASFCLLGAFVVVLLGRATADNRLLTTDQKESIQAAGGSVGPCFLINVYNCGALSGTSSGGTVTGCGMQSFPSCTGDCTNSCSRTTIRSWSCQSVNSGGVRQLSFV